MLDFYKKIQFNPGIQKIKAGDVTIVEYNCPLREEWLDAWSTHNCIAFVLTGDRKWKTATREYYFSKGDLLFARKGGYYVGDVTDRGMCMILFLFPDEWLKNMVTELAALRTQRVVSEAEKICKLECNPAVEGVIITMMQYLTSRHPIPGQLVLLKMKELLYGLFMGGQNACLLEYLLRISSETKPSIREIMEDNYYYNLKLEDYARLSGRSLTAFKDEFKALYQVPPGKWLSCKRLEHAQHLILNTSHPISEVAFQSGFQNTTHFVKAFKDFFGKPPHAYRQHAMAS